MVLQNKCNSFSPSAKPYFVIKLPGATSTKVAPELHSINIKRLFYYAQISSSVGTWILAERGATRVMFSMCL